MGRNRRLATVKGLFSFLMTVVLVWGLVGCGDRIETPQTVNPDKASKTQLAGSLSEVAPPPVIQQLSQFLEAYQPQVTIVSPKADEVLQDTTVSVKLQVQDLAIFQEPELGIGPHLEVILDNQPYTKVYDLNQPLVIPELEPGTHTLRVFASRPWDESFKNEGAYAQTTFHVFTKTPDNNPDPALPLLTYSSPTGSYGAEPILLDFYLTNAPLHLVAQENPDDEIADWRIRVTINDRSFVLDRWQSVYLKGFKRGKNWVQLEFLDEQGNPVKNVFNNTVRLINYEPKGKDTLSKLVSGEFSTEVARSIVEPNYKLKETPTPSPVETPLPSPSPTVTPTPIPSVTPSLEETPSPEPATPEEKPTPPTELAPPEAKQTQKPKSGSFSERFRRPAEAPSPSLEPVVPEEPEQTPEPEASTTPIESPEPTEEPTPAIEAAPTEASQPQKPKFGGFFERFRRIFGASSQPPKQPEPLEAPSLKPTVVPTLPESQPEVTPEPEKLAVPSAPPASVEEPTTADEPIKPEVKPEVTPEPEKLAVPSAPPASVEEPTTADEPIKPEVKPEVTPEPEKLAVPSAPPASVEEPTTADELIKPEVKPAPVIQPAPVTPIQPEQPKSNGSSNRVQSPTADKASPESGLPPTLPEIVETPFPKPSPAEAAFPQPKPSIAPEPESSPATPQESIPIPESLTDKAPAVKN